MAITTTYKFNTLPPTFSAPYFPVGRGTLSFMRNKCSATASIFHSLENFSARSTTLSLLDNPTFVVGYLAAAKSHGSKVSQIRHQRTGTAAAVSGGKRGRRASRFC